MTLRDLAQYDRGEQSPQPIKMSRLLEEAIEQLRELPEDEQDNAADTVFAYLASEERQYQYDRPRFARKGANQ
jgi:hypothetical protein